MEKLYERIKFLRKEKNWKQTEAAELLEISITSYCRYERGEREPTASVLIQIADFYGVSIDYLVGRTEKRQVRK